MKLASASPGKLSTKPAHINQEVPTVWTYMSKADIRPGINLKPQQMCSMFMQKLRAIDAPLH